MKGVLTVSLLSLTLISFYNYDNTLFDNLVLPDEIDRDALIYLLLQRYGEFDLIYTDLDFLKVSFGYWSKSHQVTFEKWLDGFKAEYNPIENYDRIEEITDYGHNSNSNHSNASNLNRRSGYNNNNMVDDSGNSSDSSFNGEGDYTNTHNARIHGNIGVTTAPKMLEEMFKLYGQHNIYTMICDLFADEYMIRLY